MPTPTVPSVREGFETTLRALAGVGLRVHGGWPDNLQIPPGGAVAILRRVRTEPHTSLSGRGSQYYEIVLVTVLGTLRSAQINLDRFTDLGSADSIIATLEADETLSGAAEGLLVGDWGEDGTIAINGVEYWGAILPIEVWVTY